VLAAAERAIAAGQRLIERRPASTAFGHTG
jgi:hypothetical protein